LQNNSVNGLQRYYRITIHLPDSQVTTSLRPFQAF
jgi:hypothetical protein